jgi:hypothetical protein
MDTLGLSPSAPKPATSRIRELFWPKIEDEVAVTAARNAIYACLFISASIGRTKPLGSAGCLAVHDGGNGVRQLSRAAAFPNPSVATLGDAFGKHAWRRKSKEHDVVGQANNPT